MFSRSLGDVGEVVFSGKEKRREEEEQGEAGGEFILQQSGARGTRLMGTGRLVEPHRYLLGVYRGVSGWASALRDSLATLPKPNARSKLIPRY